MSRSVQVLQPDDLVTEARKLARRRPTEFRQFFLAMRAINHIDDGEDPDLVVAQSMPMLESTDGSLN